ncbi:MAG: PAS domain S-box protein [Actinobacteria bacterium]|nr:MAG: PAS domain S-box protein [Actinomycetota bacterium]
MTDRGVTRQPAGDLEPLLAYIRSERGFDFTGYKRPSLTRRITKRMQEKGFAGYDEYQAHLAENPDEFVSLFNTILINVTSFFRDELAWDFLREEIVPRLIEARTADEAIRVWSTGCATGEEAYSLAMVFAEALGEDAFRRRVKIYATDVDEHALAQGRRATYGEKAVSVVPEALRKRYFDRADGGFGFAQSLRRAVIFGRHDLVQDPPISRIDLLVSRNTLMYFDARTQEQILTNFHFALRDDGFLFLGKSEALAARTSLFAPIDLKRRVFEKVPKVMRRARAAVPGEPQLTPDGVGMVVRTAAFDTAPVAQLVVDRDGRLTLANAQARVLFGLAERDLGRPFKDLEVSFRPVELRSRIEEALGKGDSISLREIEWRTGADARFFDVQLAPLAVVTGEVVGVAIAFTDVTRHRRLQEALQESRLEMEGANEELQSTNEELETTNEELQSTNEELETTNEELQSANEELETMNAELQSTNEELETINNELHERSIELNEANAFLDAVLGSLEVGVIVVNGELEVESWNRGARELWGLNEEEVLGRHLLNLDIGLPAEQLRAPVRDALAAETNGAFDHVRLEAVNRRGHTLEFIVTLAPLRTAAGPPRRVILMMQPVAAAT